MVIKVELIDTDGNSNCMMFGNDYKTWYQQLYEYLCQKNREGIRYEQYGFIQQSKAKWVSGGLKWCPCGAFAGYYMERNGKDADKVIFGKPSSVTLTKFFSILIKVSKLRLNK